MTLTDKDLKALVFSKCHTSPATFDDAVQEARIAAFQAETEQPGNKKHAIDRAITAGRNMTRRERIYQRNFGGGDYAGPASITDEAVREVLVAEEKPPTSLLARQQEAFDEFLSRQDFRVREVVERYMRGENMFQISNRTGISHSQVSRMIKQFKEDAAKQIGQIE
jgi:DNA-directed RNA polymerase specialized sigma24 family protein